MGVGDMQWWLDIAEMFQHLVTTNRQQPPALLVFSAAPCGAPAHCISMLAETHICLPASQLAHLSCKQGSDLCMRFWSPPCPQLTSVCMCGPSS
jgi:hypothetical protein